MDGTAVAAISELARKAESAVVEVDGRTLGTGPLYTLPMESPEPTAETLTFHTLEGFARYLERGEFRHPSLIHVVNERHVQLVSGLIGEYRQREVVAEAVFEPAAIAFERFVDPETFVVMLQARFVDTGDRADVLQVVGTIRDQAVTTLDDDGVTQSVTASAGVVRRQDVNVPNPVMLAPRRSFPEIAQPASPFVLRIRRGQDGELPTSALFEADGGAWKLDAISSIADWLSARLDNDSWTILA